ncbi:MAG: hypothetical protein PF450_02210 [Bacteroidales bacterium]|jgi:hypothetical protein|nr:hypothetical protein [Bacteroidales bacterium]
MGIEEVLYSKQAREFLKVPKILYKNDPFWVCPLDNEIEAIFDPKKNTFYNHGSATRYILKNEKGKLCGRVAVFFDEKLAHSYDQPTGGMGFLECINDHVATN